MELVRFSFSLLFSEYEITGMPFVIPHWQERNVTSSLKCLLTRGRHSN
jgi:hypothetical protein